MIGYQGIRGSTPGLLGGPQSQGLLGGQGQGTQNMMQQYLQQLFMRRYNPPAMQGGPGMVGSQMGPGGMQYQAPQRPQAQVQQQQQQPLATDPAMQAWWQRNVGQYMPDGGSQQGFNQWSGGA